MEVRVNSTKTILSGFAIWLVPFLAAGLMFAACGGLFFIKLTSESLGLDRARSIAWTFPLIIWIGGLIYTWYFASQLSRSRISLSENVLSIRNPGEHGAQGKDYNIDEIEAIVFGETPDLLQKSLWKLHQMGVPRTGGAILIKDISTGKMTIIEKSGRKETYVFLNKIYDLASLLELATELRKRGVNVAAREWS